MVEYRQSKWDEQNSSSETELNSSYSSNIDSNQHSVYNNSATQSNFNQAETNQTNYDYKVNATAAKSAMDFNQSAEQNVSYKEKKSLSFSKLLALVLIASLAVGSSFGFTYIKLSTNNTELASEKKQQKENSKYYIESNHQVTPIFNQKDVNSIPALYKQLAPNVVSITNHGEVEDFFYGKQNIEGSGTGVIFNINKDSVLIVTNYHVIADANELLVAFDNENTIKALLVGGDPATDIAVIKVNKADIPVDTLNSLSAVPLGDSDKAQVGEMVVAIGNPLGYDDTLTVGFVSGINRKINTRTGKQIGLIQTDASINPGNSGGALVNMRGELIGINSIKITNTGRSASFFGGASGVTVDNMGFAIPINAVKEVVDEILTKGYVSKPYIGIKPNNITDQIAKKYNLSKGIFVEEVFAGSGAAEAGLQYGDIITDVDGKGITSTEELVEYIKSKKIGEKIRLNLDRRGRHFEVDVELKEKVTIPDEK